MIKELVAFGNKLREEQSKDRIIHNALKEETISIDLVLNQDGSFYMFQPVENIKTTAESILAKKGKARLLLDKPEEVLCIDTSDSPTEKTTKETNEKHKRFLKKLEYYSSLDSLKPVFLFYNQNRKNGLNKANKIFIEQNPIYNSGNIAFRLVGEDIRIHENKEVINKIISCYNEIQKKKLKSSSIFKCSICGKNDFPITNEPHGKIKNIPGGQPSGCSLVSYNKTAFESYNLKKNLNSAICTNCARLYVEGLNELLSSGQYLEDKNRVKYNHRKKIGTDTVIVFWTRNNKKVDEIDFLDEPNEELINELINSAASSKHLTTSLIDDDLFYAFSLSGASARIAVRDWIELSLSEYKKNIALWFQDIRIISHNTIQYPSLYHLSNSANNEKVKDETIKNRVAVYLWQAALKNSPPPLWILTLILKRIRNIEKDDENKKKYDSFTKERASLIRASLKSPILL